MEGDDDKEKVDLIKNSYILYYRTIGHLHHAIYTMKYTGGIVFQWTMHSSICICSKEGSKEYVLMTGDKMENYL